MLTQAQWHYLLIRILSLYKVFTDLNSGILKVIFHIIFFSSNGKFTKSVELLDYQCIALIENDLTILQISSVKLASLESASRRFIFLIMKVFYSYDFQIT
jgi:hypothetical protein